MVQLRTKQLSDAHPTSNFGYGTSLPTGHRTDWCIHFKKKLQWRGKYTQWNCTFLYKLKKKPWRLNSETHKLCDCRSVERLDRVGSENNNQIQDTHNSIDDKNRSCYRTASNCDKKWNYEWKKKSCIHTSRIKHGKELPSCKDQGSKGLEDTHAKNLSESRQFLVCFISVFFPSFFIQFSMLQGARAGREVSWLILVIFTFKFQLKNSFSTSVHILESRRIGVH